MASASGPVAESCAKAGCGQLSGGSISKKRGKLMSGDPELLVSHRRFSRLLKTGSPFLADPTQQEEVASSPYTALHLPFPDPKPGSVRLLHVAAPFFSSPPFAHEDKPNKSYYDPRKWIRESETSMATRQRDGWRERMPTTHQEALLVSMGWNLGSVRSNYRPYCVCTCTPLCRRVVWWSTTS